MGIATPDSQLVFLGSHLEACHPFFNDKRINALISLFGMCLCNYQVNACGIAVGNPIFCAVEEIVVSLIQGSGFLGSGIAPGFGFRQAKGPKGFPRAEFTEILFFLGFRAEGLQPPAHQRIVYRYNY
jgi:hypothetical protein